MNKVIRILISSNVFLNSGWGLLSPVFAIFIVQNIAGGDPLAGAKVAGFAALAYWLTKSALQIPIGKYLDKNHGEKDDFWFMTAGLFLAGLAPFGFMISSQSWHIYSFQVLHAVGMAMMIPSWSAIFTRHIDKNKEAFEWGTNSTALGFGVGIAGAVGGIMAVFFGFNIIFILVGGFTIVSSVLMLRIRKEISPKNRISRRSPALEDTLTK